VPEEQNTMAKTDQPEDLKYAESHLTDVTIMRAFLAAWISDWLRQYRHQLRQL